jgi:hypothetical protein
VFWQFWQLVPGARLNNSVGWRAAASRPWVRGIHVTKETSQNTPRRHRPPPPKRAGQNQLAWPVSTFSRQSRVAAAKIPMAESGRSCTDFCIAKMSATVERSSHSSALNAANLPCALWPTVAPRNRGSNTFFHRSASFVDLVS